MNFIPGIETATGGLQAQRTRLDLVSQNIANAQTTRGPDGRPYARKIVSFETELVRHIDGNGSHGGTGLQTVRVANVRSDPTPGPALHQPGHPDADAEGFVRLPNVNMAMEMIDLISASRAYEANLSIVRTGREMAQRTLDIGK
jgi:flagellar basal-body rod protein FlgC